MDFVEWFKPQSVHEEFGWIRDRIAVRMITPSDSRKTAYHRRLRAEQNGLLLLQPFIEEWNDDRRRSIWQNLIEHRLGISSQRIHARECKISHETDVNKFLEENHLQGSIRYQEAVALLTPTGKIVAAMTFAEARFNRQFDRELLRFAIRSGTHVPGAAQRLWRAYCRQHTELNVVSYCDLRFGSGSFYELLGFERTGTSEPNYFYVDPAGKWYSRLHFQKHRLGKLLGTFDAEKTEVENMTMNGYRRIWDCGNGVFVFNSPHRWYVYTLTDPRKDNRPFYVGKGEGNRAYHHLQETFASTTNEFKFNTIQAIRLAGKQPGVRIMARYGSEEEAYAQEAILIDHYGMHPNGILTNRVVDARPPRHDGKIRSEETIRKLSLSNSSTWILTRLDGSTETITNLKQWCTVHGYRRQNFHALHRGNCADAHGYSRIQKLPSAVKTDKSEAKAERCRELAKKRIGIPLSSEQKNKIRDASIGRKHSEESKQKRSTKLGATWRLIQEDGTEHVVFSLNQFAKDHGWSVGNLHKLATGKTKKVYGFVACLKTSPSA